nr:unnamed protein product [Digitaria exilis]
MLPTAMAFDGSCALQPDGSHRPCQVVAGAGAFQSTHACLVALADASLVARGLSSLVTRADASLVARGLSSLVARADEVACVDASLVTRGSPPWSPALPCRPPVLPPSMPPVSPPSCAS